MYYPPIEMGIWRQLVLLREKISSETIIYTLLFLFPIFAVTLRHWVSDIFVLLSLITLILLFRNRQKQHPLFIEERILLWCFAIYFVVFIITALINGWSMSQTKNAAVEVRFLMFIPMYLAFRQMPDGIKWLLTGAVLGVIATSFGGILYMIYGNGDPSNIDTSRYYGAYSPLLTGPITLLFAATLIPFFYERIESKWLRMSLLLVVAMTLFVLALTVARNAILALLPLCILIVFFLFKGTTKYFYSVLIVAIFIFVGLFVDKVNNRITVATQQFSEYFSLEDPAEYKLPLNSVAVRLEMWRVTPMFFKDNPVFGIGRGNYSKEIVKYYRKKMIHPDIMHHSHPHNAYSEMLISKGLIGLFSFIGIFIYPFVLLIKSYRSNIRSALFGIILITSYMIFSLTDASTFIKGNYSSLYIILLAVFFSYYIQEKRQRLKLS